MASLVVPWRGWSDWVTRSHSSDCRCWGDRRDSAFPWLAAWGTWPRSHCLQDDGRARRAGPYRSEAAVRGRRPRTLLACCNEVPLWVRQRHSTAAFRQRLAQMVCRRRGQCTNTAAIDSQNDRVSKPLPTAPRQGSLVPLAAESHGNWPRLLFIWFIPLLPAESQVSTRG